MQSNLRGALFSLAAFGAYATHDVVVKLLGETYSSFQIMFFSGLMGFPLVMMMLMGDRRESTLIPRHPWWSALRSVAAVSTGVMGFFAFSQLPMAHLLCDLLRHAASDHADGDPDAGRKGRHAPGHRGDGRPGRGDHRPAPGCGEASPSAISPRLARRSPGRLTSVIVRKIGQDERSVVLMLYPWSLTFFAMGAVMPFVYVPMPITHLGLTAVMAFLGMLGALGIIAAYRSRPRSSWPRCSIRRSSGRSLYGWLFFDETVDLIPPSDRPSSSPAASTSCCARGRHGSARTARAGKPHPDGDRHPAPHLKLAETVREVGRPGVNALAIARPGPCQSPADGVTPAPRSERSAVW